MAGPARNQIDRAELLAAEPGDGPPRGPERVLPEMSLRFRRLAFAMAACGFVAWLLYRREAETGSFTLDLVSLVGAVVVATLAYYAGYLAFLGLWAARSLMARLK